MTKTTSLFALIFLFFTACSQQEVPSRIQPLISESVENKDSSEVQLILELWEEYLNERLLKIKNWDTPYWSTEELNQRRFPDHYLVDVKGNNADLQTAKPTVLAVQKIDDFYRLKTAFSCIDSLTGQAVLQHIVNVHAIKEGENWKLHTPMDWNTRHWKHKTVGNIDYHFRPAYEFNQQEAERLNAFNDSLAQFLKVLPIKFDYYLCENPEELFRIQGYEYSPSMFMDRQYGGRAETYNRILLAGNNSEYYAHEVVHLYTNLLYSRSAHYLFDEGFATYFGGSTGFPLEWHLRAVNHHLQRHPDLTYEELKKHPQISGDTNFLYAFGGLLVKKAIKRERLAGLEKVMRAGRTKEDLYPFLETYFGAKEAEMTRFIRDAFAPYE